VVSAAWPIFFAWPIPLDDMEDCSWAQDMFGKVGDHLLGWKLIFSGHLLPDS